MFNKFRISLEKRIVRKIVADVLAAGRYISVNDGEEWVLEHSRDRSAILAAMFTTDEDGLQVEDEKGVRVGLIRLIYGNSPWEVINDYSWRAGNDDTSEEEMKRLLAGSERLGEKLEQQYDR